MLSALIHSIRSYSAVRLAAQPIHQRYVQPGPLVLEPELRKYPAPATDRDRTVSRRSEPSSRATLIGEQPNPWDLLPYAIALYRRLPNALRAPWEASVTLLEATTPVKLPTMQCLPNGISPQTKEGPYFNDGSTIPDDTDSKPPAYPTHPLPKSNAKLQ